MKKILISINPKWVKRILNGDKTIEVRKTAPKCELPCEVYIYCTKGKPYLTKHCFDGKYHTGNCLGTYDGVANNEPLNGLVVAKFTLKKITPIGKDMFGYCPFTSEILDGEWLGKGSCLTQNDLRRYLGDKTGYAWHIDNLVIFDKPKELKDYGVKYSPQSYCYCEVEE